MYVDEDEWPRQWPWWSSNDNAHVIMYVHHWKLIYNQYTFLSIRSYIYKKVCKKKQNIFQIKGDCLMANIDKIVHNCFWQLSLIYCVVSQTFFHKKNIEESTIIKSINTHTCIRIINTNTHTRCYLKWLKSKVYKIKRLRLKRCNVKKKVAPNIIDIEIAIG